MRNQLVVGNTRLRAERSADQKLERRPVATVNLELMRTIVGQVPVGIIQQTYQVEQRSDVRI